MKVCCFGAFGFRYHNPPSSDLAVSALQVANVREVPISVANTFGFVSNIDQSVEVANVHSSRYHRPACDAFW
jgi:hypothetical protein